MAYDFPLPGLGNNEDFQACMQKARKLHGPDLIEHFHNQTVEECAEFIQARVKLLRSEIDDTDANVRLIEELADVAVCINAIWETMDEADRALFSMAIGKGLIKWRQAYEE